MVNFVMMVTNLVVPLHKYKMELFVHTNIFTAHRRHCTVELFCRHQG